MATSARRHPGANGEQADHRGSHRLRNGERVLERREVASACVARGRLRRWRWPGCRTAGSRRLGRASRPPATQRQERPVAQDPEAALAGVLGRLLASVGSANDQREQQRARDERDGVHPDDDPQPGRAEGTEHSGGGQRAESEAPGADHVDQGERLVLRFFGRHVGDQREQRAVEQLEPGGHEDRADERQRYAVSHEVGRHSGRLHELRENDHRARARPIDETPRNRRDEQTGHRADRDDGARDRQRQAHCAGRVHQRPTGGRGRSRSCRRPAPPARRTSFSPPLPGQPLAASLSHRTICP